MASIYVLDLANLQEREEALGGRPSAVHKQYGR